jgi:hypothetical protein
MRDWMSVKLGRVYLSLEREEGQGSTEYAMVLGVLVVLLAASLGVVGAGITDFLGRVAGRLDLLLPAA